MRACAVDLRITKGRCDIIVCSRVKRRGSGRRGGRLLVEPASFSVHSLWNGPARNALNDASTRMLKQKAFQNGSAAWGKQRLFCSIQLISAGRGDFAGLSAKSTGEAGKAYRALRLSLACNFARASVGQTGQVCRPRLSWRTLVRGILGPRWVQSAQRVQVQALGG